MPKRTVKTKPPMPPGPEMGPSRIIEGGPVKPPLKAPEEPREAEPETDEPLETSEPEPKPAEPTEPEPESEPVSQPNS